MEFVVVKFPRVRDVIVDGQQMGQTGGLIRLQTGTHRFSLGGSPDCTPAVQRIRVIGTSHDKPMEISFAAMITALEDAVVSAQSIADAANSSEPVVGTKTAKRMGVRGAPGRKKAVARKATKTPDTMPAKSPATKTAKKLTKKQSPKKTVRSGAKKGATKAAKKATGKSGKKVARKATQMAKKTAKKSVGKKPAQRSAKKSVKGKPTKQSARKSR